MKFSKKIAAIFVAVLMVVSAIPFSASAVTFSASISESRKLNVPALNVGDLVTGYYSGVDYDGRTLVLDYEDSQYNAVNVTLSGDYTIQNGMISNGEETYFNGSMFWEVTSISNGVVTLGNNTVNGAVTGMTGYMGNPSTTPLTISSGGMGGPSIPGFGNPSFGDEEEDATGVYREKADHTKLYYYNLEDAVADSLEGETIGLCADVDLTKEYGRSTASHIFYLENRTLDLNGYTISMYNHGVGFAGDNMTITNGTFTCVPTTTNVKTSYSLPIYPEIFTRQSTTSSDLNTVSDKSTGVVLEDLVLNPGGLNVKGAEVVCKNLTVTGSYYYAVSAEFDSTVTIESGSYTTSNGAATLISTSDKTDGTPKLDDNTQYIIKGGTFNLGSATKMFASTNNKHFTVIGGTFQNSSNEKVDVSAYFDTAIYYQDVEGTVLQGDANNGANITVADTISENFYIDDTFYGDNAYVAVTYNHASNTSVTEDVRTDVKALSSLEEYDNSKSVYDGNKIISVPQAPAQIIDEIVINIYATSDTTEAPVKTITYSTKAYCDSIIGGNYSAELKELAETTLDYAAAAQVYFGYNTDNLANGGTYKNDVAGADLSGVAGFTSKTDGLKAATMVVKSDLEINLLFTSETTVTGASMADASGSRFTAANAGQNGSYYVIHIGGIEAANMDNTITINTDQGTIQFTANTIMKVMANSSNANTAMLAKAMYLYGVAADAYFA